MGVGGGFPPEPPGRAGAGVSSHPRYPSGTHRSCCRGGDTARVPPWGMGSPAPHPCGPPPAGKVLGINNAHCFPLMNITDLPGRQLRAPAGGAGASPAFPRPGTPLPSPDVPGVPAAARQSEGLAAAFTPLPPWVSLGSWSKTRGKLGGVQGLGVSPGGSLPLLTSPLYPRTGSGCGGRWVGSCWERNALSPEDARSSPARQRCRVTPVPGPQQCPLPTEGPGDTPGLGLGLSPEQGPTGQGSVSGGCSPIEAYSRTQEVPAHPQRHKDVPEPGDGHVPAAHAPHHGGGAGGMPSSCHGHALPRKGSPASPHRPASTISNKPTS